MLCEQEELSFANKRLQNAQKQISKYIDPNVAEKIFEGEFTAELSHRRTKLTMFFSDIQEFTQFTDASDPEDVAKLLNGLFRRNGSDSSDLGWNDSTIYWRQSSTQFSEHLIHRASEMTLCHAYAWLPRCKKKMKTLRKKWWNQGIQLPFEIRCGIHTGMANVGNYGSEGFMGIFSHRSEH